MKHIVFDAEGDGLSPSKFHCVSYEDEGVVRSVVDYDDMRNFLSKAELLIGHNIIRWDIPNLERVLKIKIHAKLVDTLAISWYLEPDRPRHGLESYGEDFGIQKPQVEDWLSLRAEDYIHRCQEDVRINSRLWKDQWKRLVNLYGSETQAWEFVEYLSFKMDCAKEQEQNGWKLDVDRCITVRDKLMADKEAKIVELTYAMPKVPIYARKFKPAKPFKKNGSLSKSGEDWFSFIEQRGLSTDYDGIVEYIKDWKEPNPNSHDQIKSWLYSLGWEPSTFQYKRDKDTGDVRKIAQVAQDKTKGPGLCPSVKRLIAKEPKLELLDGLSILSHRISILNGFLENVDDRGYIKAEIQGLTNTLRFKHKTVVNLPGVQNPYGEDIRGCLICPEGYELCGSDMSSLEDRLKQHYMWPYDPEYVKEMSKPDFDPHLDLALSANAVTEAEVKEYKQAEHKDKKVKEIRHTHKQGNYACQYGAQVARLALTIGCNRDTAQRIFDAYWKRNWAINKAAEDQTVKVSNGMKWLYNPVSKFWYSLRHEKDRFSTLVQGTAVYCFDGWIRQVRKKGPPIIGQFHDEFVAIIRTGNEERCTLHIQRAITSLNEELKLNRELGCDVQFGLNYSEIH